MATGFMKLASIEMGAALLCVVGLGCGARSTLADPESEPECVADDRMESGGAWSRSLGATGDLVDGNGAQLARGSDGRLVAAWRTAEALEIDCTKRPVVGGVDLVVASFEPTGELVWALRFGVANGGGITAHELGTDQNGNVYIAGTGTHGGAMKIGEKATPSELFAFSLDREGDVRWAHGYERSEATFAKLGGATVSPEGELTLAYTYQGTLFLGERAIEGGVRDAGRDKDLGRLIVTWDPSGTVVRSSVRFDAAIGGLRAGANGLFAISWLPLDGPGVLELHRGDSTVWTETMSNIPNLLWFRGGLVIGSSSPALAPPKTWLRAVRISGGDLLWSTAFDEWTGGERDWPPYATHLIDVADDMVAASPLLGSVDLGDHSAQSAGGFDALLVRLEDGGLPVALRRFGGSGDESIAGLVPVNDQRVGALFQSDDAMDLGFGAQPAACAAPCDQLTLAVIDAP